MEVIQAKIILKKREECSARLKKYGENCGRCSPCPLRTSLDDYIEALEVIEQDEERKRHGSNESENGND